MKCLLFVCFFTYGTVIFLAAGTCSYKPNDVMYMSLVDYSVMSMKHWSIYNEQFGAFKIE